MPRIKCLDKFGKEYEFEEPEYIYRKAVYGLIFQDNLVLMIKDTRSGRLELPGGGVDTGETDTQALAREFIEETGLSIKNDFVLLENVKGYYYSLGDNKPWNTDRFYYKVELDGQGKLLAQGNGADTIGAEFVNINKLNELNIAPTDLSIIQNYLNLTGN